MADALIIGNLGGGLHYSRAQNEYMKREPHPYMQVIRAVSDSNLLGQLLAFLPNFLTIQHCLRDIKKHAVSLRAFTEPICIVRIIS